MNILIVGGGAIGKRHIKNLRSLGFDDILCLKRNEDDQFSLENKVKVVCSYEEAFAHNVRVVFVCTPTSLHNEAIQFAVKANAALFMEKPLINTREGLNKEKDLLSNY